MQIHFATGQSYELDQIITNKNNIENLKIRINELVEELETKVSTEDFSKSIGEIGVLINKLELDFNTQGQEITTLRAELESKASQLTELVNKVNHATNRLNAKAADSVVVKLSGNQTINDVKTFGAIPVLPSSNPTTDNQAARKGYVDSHTRWNQILGWINNIRTSAGLASVNYE